MAAGNSFLSSTRKRHLGLVLASYFLIASTSARTSHSLPCLKRLSLPGYPSLARVANIEGNVYYEIELDSKCSIVRRKGPFGGTPELQRATERALVGTNNLEFSSCGDSGSTVKLIFAFALRGSPTNEWAPTMFRVRQPYVVEITTRPADLKALGLQKVQSVDRNKETGEDQLQIPEVDQTGCLCLRDYSIPSNAVVRDSGMQGEVAAKIHLDANCRVAKIDIQQLDETGGHEIMRVFTKQAVEKWRFSGCQGQETDTSARFRFLLSGDRTNDWSPTTVSISADRLIEISSNPPD